MAESQKSSGKLRISSDGRMGAFSRFAVFVLVILVILLVAGVFLVRTDGGRVFVSDWLSKRLGFDVKVENARIGLPYVLVAENVVSKDFEVQNTPGCRIQELRVGIGFSRPFWRIRAKQLVLVLVQAKDQSWAPSVFGRLGNLPLSGVSDLSGMTSLLRPRMTLRVTDLAINWFAYEAEPVWASGINFSMLPADVPGRNMYYYSLDVDNWVGVGLDKVRNIHREWLADDKDDYIEISSSISSKRPGRNSFWDVNVK